MKSRRPSAGSQGKTERLILLFESTWIPLTVLLATSISPPAPASSDVLEIHLRDPAGTIELAISHEGNILTSIDPVSQSVTISDACNEREFIPSNSLGVAETMGIGPEGGLGMNYSQPLSIKVENNGNWYSVSSGDISSKIPIDLENLSWNWETQELTLRPDTVDGEILHELDNHALSTAVDAVEPKIRALENSIRNYELTENGTVIPGPELLEATSDIAASINSEFANPNLLATRHYLMKALNTIQENMRQPQPVAQLMEQLQSLKFSIRKSRRTHSFEVRSAPSGARVEFLTSIDDSPRHQRHTNVRISSLAPGKYLMRIRSYGYKPYERFINLYDMEIGLINCTLKPSLEDGETRCLIRES